MNFKLRNYPVKEIGTKPKIAEEHQLDLGKGMGHYTFFIQSPTMAMNYFTLFIGGGSESEPIFKVQHKFETEKECVLYTQMIYFRELSWQQE